MEASSRGVCGLQRGLSSVLFLRVKTSGSPIKIWQRVKMSVKCSFTPSCLHAVVTISLWHAHPAYSAAASSLFLSLPATARVYAVLDKLALVCVCRTVRYLLFRTVAVHIKAHLKVSTRTVTRLSLTPFLEKGRWREAGPEVEVIVTAVAPGPSVLVGCRPDVDGWICQEWAKDRGMEKERFCEPTAAGWNF